MHSFKPILLAGCIILIFIAACDTKTVPSASAIPADPSASADSRAVLAYLSALTLDAQPGIIIGQNTGHGNQVLDPEGFFGYESLIGMLTDQNGETPGIIGLDYEHEHVYTPEQLSAANKVLIAHWQKGGLVTINWSPLNPWLNDESDLFDHPGVWTDTRTTGAHMESVDLRLLLDKQSLLYSVWHRKLDRITAALQELEDAGVVVLWRPMQEMNGNWFWWGISTSLNDPGPYVALWREMFKYFTETKGLHNLLWVYSPATTWFDPLQQSIRPADWAYPGDDYVDVVAGTAYNDRLDIGDYAAYLKFGKALGMAEFGPTLGGDAARTGTFDNTLRISRLQTDYPAISYFVAWHDWNNGDGTQEHQSIVGNQNAAAMLQDPSALTLDRLGWKAFQK